MPKNRKKRKKKIKKPRGLSANNPLEELGGMEGLGDLSKLFGNMFGGEGGEGGMPFDMSALENEMPNFDINKFYQEKIKVHLEEGVELPVYGTKGSSGVDLMAREEVIVRPWEAVIVPTGIRVDIPPGMEIQIRPRSGNSLKKSFIIANSPGTIDSDYRGEVGIIVRNLCEATMTIPKGMKLAQAVLAPVFHIDWQVVETIEDLDKTERGEGGFGSTDEPKEELKESFNISNEVPMVEPESLDDGDEVDKSKPCQCKGAEDKICDCKDDKVE